MDWGVLQMAVTSRGHICGVTKTGEEALRPGTLVVQCLWSSFCLQLTLAVSVDRMQDTHLASAKQSGFHQAAFIINKSPA